MAALYSEFRESPPKGEGWLNSTHRENCFLAHIRRPISCPEVWSDVISIRCRLSFHLIRSTGLAAPRYTKGYRESTACRIFRVCGVHI